MTITRKRSNSAAALFLLAQLGTFSASGQPLPLPGAPEQVTQTREVTNADVEKAIERAVMAITARQARDGRWLSPALDKDYPNALTALVAWALRESGAEAADWRIVRVAGAFRDRSQTRTSFARACTLLLWCSLDPVRYKREIDEDVKFLMRKQLDSGGWSDAPAPAGGSEKGAKPPQPPADRITSTLVTLALSEAARTGTRVGARIWRLEEELWLGGVGADGGWGFAPPAADGSISPMQLSNGAATAGGVATLYLIYDQRYLAANLKFNGRFKAKCGQPSDKNRSIIATIEAGWGWLGEHLSSEGIPGLLMLDGTDIRLASEPYYLYAVSRMSAASGRKRAGSLELSREIARRLVRSQGVDGSWGNVYDTCFGILALSNVRMPAVFGKLTHAGHEPWHTDPRDVANLTERLSRKYGSRVTWRSVGLDEHIDDAFDAPVLLISGHAAPKLDEASTTKLRGFVEAGGTILAMACCSKAEFGVEMRELFARVLPRAIVGPVDQNHPVWSMVEKLKPGEDLLGVSNGCRTVAFLLDTAACCAWQQDLVREHARYFDLAANVTVYATYNRAPSGGLVPYLDWPEGEPAVDPDATRLSVARLRHKGDWWSGEAAWRRFSRKLAGTAGLVVEVKQPTNAEQARLSGADVLWVTGHTFKAFRSAGRAEIKAFLARGGTILATACCGSEQFDAAFQAFGSRLFGSAAWQLIPADDPLMSGAFLPGGEKSLSGMMFRVRHGAPPPAKAAFPVLYGLKRDDRWAVIYSPYDINCGVAGHTCLHCVGYRPADAATLVTTALLYAAKPPAEDVEQADSPRPAEEAAPLTD